VTKIKMKVTGRYAHVALGEWDGTRYALDEDYPIYLLSDGRHVVLLEGVDELPEPAKGEMNAAKANGKKEGRT